MFRSLLAIVLVASLATLSHGQQFPSEFWHAGKVVLVSGDTLQGEVKYDLENDIVRIQTATRLFAYSSRKLFFFEIFDVTVDNYRQFYVLDYNVRPGYKAPYIFEVVFEGKLTLLARESIVQQTSQYNSYYWSGGTYNRQALNYDFYFLDGKGNITFYNKKKKELIDMFGRKGPQVRQFIKKNNLKTDKKRDLARIMAYYNAILDS